MNEVNMDEASANKASVKQRTKGYKERADGGFRLRASFPMDRDLILKANMVCEQDNISMYALCRFAVAQYVDGRLARSAGLQKY